MGRRSSRYEFPMVFLFVMMHAGVLAVFLVPFSPSLLLWTAATYAIRMFAVTAGYRRYFSHRSYRLGRTAQFCMAALAQSSGQKGVLWWAATTDGTIVTPTPSPMFTRRDCAASGGRTWGGPCRTSTTAITKIKLRISRSFQSCAG